MFSPQFVEGGKAQNAPCRSSFWSRISDIEAAARSRDLRRLERLENQAIERRENEELRLCAMAAGEAVALSCQKDNISRKSLNRTYYNRCAVALQANISRWVLSVGKKYASADIRERCDSIGYTPELLKKIEKVAKIHVAEFTITMKSESGADLTKERRRFSQAWNAFNKRYLKEIAADYFGDFVRVFEAHKSGVLHAHVLIECKKPLCIFDENGNPIPFKFKPSGAVDGRTVADWCLHVWKTIRTGQLDYLGIGERHTLQPIRKGVNLFARYISKYISKDIVNRKPHLRGLRMVAYSQGFLNGVRVLPYDYDKSEIVTYFSKTENAFKQRYKRFTAFDIEGASTRVRRLKMRTLCRWCGVSKAKFKRKLGAKWGFLTRNLISKIPVSKNVYENFNKWERFAAVRNMCGDKSKCVMQFDSDNSVYDYAEFMKFDSETRQKKEWHVCGFVEGGAFLSLKNRLKCAFTAIAREFDNVYNMANAQIMRTKSELKPIFEAKKQAFIKYENGKLRLADWLNAMKTFAVKQAAICEDVKKWLPDLKKKVVAAIENEIKPEIQTQFAF